MPASRIAASISGQTFRWASTYSSILSGRTWRTKALRCVMSPPRSNVSGPLVRALDRRSPAFAGKPLRVTPATESLDRIGFDADLRSQASDQRAHVGLERLE